MRTQGIYINVSRRNDDLPQLIQEYSEQFNLSKPDTVAENFRAYPKLLRIASNALVFHGRYILFPFKTLY